MDPRQPADAPDHCGLCGALNPAPFAQSSGRAFFECSRCRLVQVAPGQRPDRATERARYDEHRNDPTDPGYRAFLARLAEPLARRLSPGARGLDFGAGPGPALAAILEEAGFTMALYDPFYAPDPAPLSRTYEFITCTETAEHFHAPGREIDRLDGLLEPGGWLGIMTNTRDESRPFEGWWYVRDPTHVCFYHAATFAWIAEDRGWSLERPHEDVALFRKPARGAE